MNSRASLLIIATTTSLLALTGCGGAVGGGQTAPDAGNPPPQIIHDEGGPPLCVLDESSSLPHVRIVFTSDTCVFTQAQAAAKVTIEYDLVVDQDVPGFIPGSPYFYGSTAANLALDEVVSGGSQKYCLCDKGLPFPECPTSDGGLTPPLNPPDGPCGPVTIPAGTYHRSFTWDGRNWDGPSDTDSPEGAAFPPGDYQLKVATAPGSFAGSGPLSALGLFRVRVVP